MSGVHHFPCSISTVKSFLQPECSQSDIDMRVMSSCIVSANEPSSQDALVSSQDYLPRNATNLARRDDNADVSDGTAFALGRCDAKALYKCRERLVSCDVRFQYSLTRSSTPSCPSNHSRCGATGEPQTLSKCASSLKLSAYLMEHVCWSCRTSSKSPMSSSIPMVACRLCKTRTLAWTCLR